MAADSDLHDPSLDALMREHSTEAPSSNVDSAILASAHEAVRVEVPRTKAGRFFRVALPIAAAASIAVVVVHLQPVVPTPPQSTKPSTVDRPRFDAARREDTRKEDSEKRTAEVYKRAPPAAAAEPQAPRATSSPAAPLQNRPVQPPDSPVSGSADTTAHGAEARAPERANAGPSPASAPARGEALSIQRGPDTSTPDQWIARIRRLRDDGKRQEAIDELARFRATFPDADARLPEDLRTLR